MSSLLAVAMMKMDWFGVGVAVLMTGCIIYGAIGRVSRSDAGTDRE